MNSVYCIKCGADRPSDDSLPCLACGAYGKSVDFTSEKISLGVDIKARRYSTFVFYKTHKLSLAIVILITLISAFSGLFFAGWKGVLVGLALGFASFLVGPYAKTKVIKEIHR